MKTATNKLSLQGINAVDDRPVAGFQTVSADSIDVLAWHLTVLALAIGIVRLRLLHIAPRTPRTRTLHTQHPYG